jgi:diaminohydroxyphosphoribosylaminopyrimidine deaminase/5-amino-6-(5-phosphoribosylamino)uracil reductase
MQKEGAVSRRARSDNSAGFRRSSAFLVRALDLARPFRTHPNPRVGCVIVDPEGVVVGEGAHRAAGEPHAEIVALRQAGDRAEGSVVYVTLEPCSHHGRTPPCVDALIASGVASVVVAVEDPDPRVSGRGVAALRAAGVDVVADVDPEAAVALDPGYFHHRRTGLPRVTLKLAATLDGQAAAADGTSQWITGEPARRSAHVLRAQSDVVMVGAGTLRTDDPRLDVRSAGYAGPQPRPVIVAGSRALPASAVVYDRDPLIYRAEIAGDEPAGAEIVAVGGAERADLTGVVKDLASRGLYDVLVEGGPTLAAALLDAGLVDLVVAYIGAKLAGGTGKPAVAGVWTTLSDAFDLEIGAADLVGGDVVVSARVVR